MLFSSEWLARYVELPETDELAELLTRCGMVVESMRPQRGGVVFDLDVPTNRVDAMNHLGVAREIATARRAELHLPDTAVAESAPEATASATVDIEDYEGCPRYAARLIRGVRIAPSPAWLAQLLEGIGLRPLNNIADITNFVLWELGHPLHAFDFDRLAEGRIVVRRARDGESLVTLDDATRELVPSDVVIADAERAVALAGIMGGAETAITNDSTNVLLEGAWFDPAAIRATAQRLNLHTDASHRFERSPAYDGMLTALDRAATLVTELAGGELAAGTIDVEGKRPEPTVTRLRTERLAALLGIEVDPGDIEDILGRLGFVLDRQEDGYAVEVPAYRPDVTREEDLVEEVGRHVGYDRLPATLPVIRSAEEPETLEVAGERRLKRVLAAAGYQEAMSSSLSSAAEQSPFVADAGQLIALKNPISEGLGILRAHLLPGLLSAVAHNVNHGQTSLRLFEVGRCFAGPLRDDGVTERWSLALVLTGSRRSPHWDEGVVSADLYDLKGTLEVAARQLAWPRWAWTPGERRGMRAGATASLEAAGGDGMMSERGFCGRISDEVARQFGIDVDVWAAEIDIQDILARPHPTPQYRPESRFPGGVRDVAVVLPGDVAYGRVERCVREAAAAADLPLAGVSLVEIYDGDEIPAGDRGMTLRFAFRAVDRTLTAAEIDAAQATLLEALVAGVAARQR